MTRDYFYAAVDTMIANLVAIKQGRAAAWAFKYHDVPLAICECAAELGGHDKTFAKMFNRKFREDATNLMFERAISEA